VQKVLRNLILGAQLIAAGRVIDGVAGILLTLIGMPIVWIFAGLTWWALS